MRNIITLIVWAALMLVIWHLGGDHGSLRRAALWITVIGLCGYVLAWFADYLYQEVMMASMAESHRKKNAHNTLPGIGGTWRNHGKY